MDPIYHLAPAARWRDWPAGTPYLPAEYDADGFVHCTAGDELMLTVANHVYRDTPGDFVLLVIDPARLTSPVKWERPGDDLAPLFPHIYGPIDRTAVVEVHQVRRGADGEFLGWSEIRD
ncbi:MAG TPA: DUF952 domain-containing protein [Roseiflexaceae bacterium]|jgi:uncharacterized protein (DUF952 family)